MSSRMMDYDEPIMFKVVPIIIGVFMLLFFCLFITILCSMWRKYARLMNSGGSVDSGTRKIFIVLDQNGNYIGGSNFPAGGGGAGGEFRYDRITGGDASEVVVTTAEDLIKCQSCSSCNCNRNRGGRGGFDAC